MIQTRVTSGVTNQTETKLNEIEPTEDLNGKSRWINDLQRLLIWCGEGDLNPHEIAPVAPQADFERLLAFLRLLIP